MYVSGVALKSLIMTTDLCSDVMQGFYGIISEQIMAHQIVIADGTMTRCNTK